MTTRAPAVLKIIQFLKGIKEMQGTKMMKERAWTKGRKGIKGAKGKTTRHASDIIKRDSDWFHQLWDASNHIGGDFKCHRSFTVYIDDW